MKDNHPTISLNEALPIVLAAFDLDQSVELIGPPGLGKTNWVRNTLAPAYAHHISAERVAVKTFELTTIEFVDARGITIPAKGEDGVWRTAFTEPPMMPSGDDAKVPGILNLDELGQCEADMQKASAPLILEHRSGDYHLPDLWKVIGCSNREEDQSGVAGRLRHFENRRCALYVRPDTDTWVDWAEREKINPFAIVFAKLFPQHVFADAVPTEPGPYSTPRSFVFAMKLLEQMSADPYELRTDGAATVALAGWLGVGVAAHLISFLKTQPDMPYWEDIIDNPKKAKLPDDANMAAQLMVTQMISHRVTRNTGDAVLTYLSRMREELQVATVRLAIKKAPQLLETEGFAAWLTEHESMLVKVNTKITK